MTLVTKIMLPINSDSEQLQVYIDSIRLDHFETSSVNDFEDLWSQ
jgi:hypothetical protein